MTTELPAQAARQASDGGSMSLRMQIGLDHEPVHTDGRTYDSYGGYAR